MLGSSLALGHRQFFLCVWFYDGPLQNKLYTKSEVASFIYYGNIRESVFKRQIRFLSHPLGELVVT